MAEPSGRWRTFFRELKRRRVFRVASFYVVGAWAAIQAAATIFPILRLPEWLTAAVVIAAIAGFPAALILAWAFDLTAEGVERTESSGRRRLLHAPWLRPLLALLLMIPIAGAGWFYFARLKPRDVETGSRSVAVFPFTVRGAESLAYLGEGMVSLLSTNLNGAGGIHSIDPDPLLRALGDTKEVGVETARRVAADFRANLMILGEITEEPGGNLRISARLYDLRSDAPPATVTIPARKQDDIAAQVDQLTEVLLGEHLGMEGRGLARTAALTTGSLAALKAYLNGETEYRASRWPRAIEAFEQALALDTSFALASYRLATAAEWAARFDLIPPAVERAYRQRQRLSTHDRELVEAYYAWTKGDANTAEARYRKITEEHPSDVEGWYRLGEVLFHYNPVRGRSTTEARTAFEHALALDPSQQPIRFHLMEIALYRRDYAAFDTLLAKAGLEGDAMLRRTAVRRFAAADSAGAGALLADLENARDGEVFAVATGLAQYSRDLERADQVARFLDRADRPPMVRAAGHLLRAQIAAGRGRWRAAQLELARLERIHRPSALLARALLATTGILSVPTAELERIHAALASWDAAAEPPFEAPGAYLGVHNGAYAPLRHYALGLLEARLGRTDSAQNRSIELLVWPDTAQRVLAGALAEGLNARLGAESAAVPTFGAVDQVANSAFFSHVADRWLLAEQKLASDPKAALPVLNSLLEGRNELFLAGPVYLRMAEAHAKLGNRELAYRYYSGFVRLWRGADPEQRAPLVAAVRAAGRLQ